METKASEAVITTNEAFLILSGWNDNNTALQVLEFGGIEPRLTKESCIIVNVDRKAETVTVLYETPTSSEAHCFDLREAEFHFAPNSAHPSHTVLVTDYPSGMKIMFVES